MKNKLLVAFAATMVVSALGLCPGLALADDGDSVYGLDLTAGVPDDELFVQADSKNLRYGTVALVNGAHCVYTWTGEPIEPDVIVKDADGNVLTKGTDFKLQYSDIHNESIQTTKAINEGSYYVYAVGIGEYSGRTQKDKANREAIFSIAKPEHDITRATVKAPTTYAYNGTDSLQGVIDPIVTLDGVQLGQGSDADYILYNSSGSWEGTGTVGEHTYNIIANGSLDQGTNTYYGMITRSYTVVDDGSLLNMFRLYNPNSGEHFYTADPSERDFLTEEGWNYEGIGWTAPASSATPVYRLYNPNAGDHHYTPSAYERDYLVEEGWNDEGVGWYSDDAEFAPLYRLYNPNAEAGAHHYTKSAAERDYLIEEGWNDENIAWYALY